MFNINEIIDKNKKNNLETFFTYLKDDFIKDIEGTAKIYTRDKELYPYKVVRLKSGNYALIDSDENIIFKNEDMHLCKVEFIMMTSAISHDNFDILNKVMNLKKT